MSPYSTDVSNTKASNMRTFMRTYNGEFSPLHGRAKPMDISSGQVPSFRQSGSNPASKLTSKY